MRDQSETGESAFERFERLTKQLLSVPKAEIDAAVQKAKRGGALARKRR